jgi:hypothetical protein
MQCIKISENYVKWLQRETDRADRKHGNVDGIHYCALITFLNTITEDKDG